MKELVESLMAWWMQPEKVAPPSFDEEFEFVGWIPGTDAGLWRSIVDQQLPWEDITELARICEDERALIVFEGTEPVSRLRRRVGWLIESKGGSIVRLTEVSEILNARVL